MGFKNYKTLFSFIILSIVSMTNIAHAQCVSPAGIAGEMGFDMTGTGAYEYCNGTSWISTNYASIDVTTSADERLEASLIAHWGLDAPSGSTITDLSGSGYDGTWSDGTGNSVAEETVTGKMGPAIHFDGANDYINIPDNADLSGGASKSFTWSFWVNPDSIPAGETHILSKEQNGANKDWAFSYKSTQLVRFYYENGAGNDGPCECSTTATLNTGEWNLITATYDGTINLLKMFVNGVYDGEYTLDFDLPDTTGPVQIGQRSYAAGTENFDGMIDDVRIYDRALTPVEVSYIYTATQNLVGHWKLDETSGSAVIDSSGNANDGNWIDAVDNAISGGETVGGKINTALELDEVTYSNIGDPTELQITGDMTLSAWVYLDDYDHAVRIISKSAGAGVRGWELTAETVATEGIDCIWARISSTGSDHVNSPCVSMTTGTWHHVVGVYETSTAMRIYIDGELEGENTTAIPASQFENPRNVWIGRKSNTSSGNFWDGKIDDVRIYTRPLSSSEVRLLYNQTQNPGLVGHWKLDETSGSTIADSSGNGNDGAWSDGSGDSVAQETTSGKSNTALNFDGVDDEIIIPDDPTNSFTASQDFTASAWVKVNSCATNGSKFFEKKDTGGGGVSIHLQCYSADNVLRFGVRDESLNDNTAFGVTPVNDNVWHHVIGVKEGNSVKVYVDGVEEDSDSTNTYGGVFDDGDLRIGNSVDGGARLVDGIVDDVRLYDRALSASEIVHLSICSKPAVMTYNFTDHVLQWCDGVLDRHDAGVAGAGGVGCAAGGTKLAGIEGTVQYDTTSNKMVFCDGSSWVDIPN